MPLKCAQFIDINTWGVQKISSFQCGLPLRVLCHTVANKLLALLKVQERLPDYVVVSYQDIILTTMLDANSRIDDANSRIDDAIIRSLVNWGIMP